MWSYFKLKKEPNLSINPLVREEELTFFIDREKEIDELNLYLSGDIAQNVLISGRVGVGKTSLVCKVGSGRKGFVRIDISYLEEDQSILERIIIALLDFATRLGAKEINELIDTFYFTRKEITIGEKRAEVKIPVASGEIGHKKGVEKTERKLIVGKELLIERLLLEIKLRIGSLPVIFLDESDHLPVEIQNRIFTIMEPLLVSNLCKVVFSTRREIKTIFCTDENSRYRARFTNDIEIGPLLSPLGNLVREIISRRLSHEAMRGYDYPFDTEFDKYIEAVSNGNLRELLRYIYLIMIETILRKLKLPIGAESALRILAEKGFLISELDIKGYQILNLLEVEALSPSDEDLQRKTGLKRSALNKKLADLEEKKALGKGSEGKRIVYRTTSKGFWLKKMYEATRL
ncbi:hypothetical protein KKC52_13860 [bacterium]|nr:hypothetical protein [bacterium]